MIIAEDFMTTKSSRWVAGSMYFNRGCFLVPGHRGADSSCTPGFKNMEHLGAHPVGPRHCETKRRAAKGGETNMKTPKTSLD